MLRLSFRWSKGVVCLRWISWCLKAIESLKTNQNATSVCLRLVAEIIMHINYCLPQGSLWDPAHHRDPEDI